MTGLHLAGRAMAAIVVGGVLLALVAAVTDAGLGASRLLSRGAHRHADRVVIIVLLALAAVSGDGVAALVLAATAVALWRVAALTRFEAPPERSASLAAARIAGRSVARAGARRAGRPSGASARPDVRIAARAVGRMVGSRRRGT